MPNEGLRELIQRAYDRIPAPLGFVRWKTKHLPPSPPGTVWRLDVKNGKTTLDIVPDEELTDGNERS